MHDLIAQTLKDLEEAKERILAFEPIVLDVDRFAAERPEIYRRIHLSYASSWVGVYTTDPSGAIGWFRDHGYDREENHPGPYTDAETGTRWWYLHRDGKPAICLEQVADGQRCRRVEVGKKEVPVYEIQCDDAAPEAPEGTA